MAWRSESPDGRQRTLPSRPSGASSEGGRRRLLSAGYESGWRRWHYGQVMLVVVTGASGSGKTTAYGALHPLLEYPSAESDQLGVPADADTAWRQRRIETWMQRVLAEPEGDLVLFGGGAPGEVLAAPSAIELDAIAICLLHCDRVTRRRRLLARGCPGDQSEDHLAFGDWIYSHAHDPSYKPEVITEHGWEQMRWERWSTWTADDPRWSFQVLDTGPLAPDAVAHSLLKWTRAWFARRHEVPLSGHWWL